MTPQTAADPKNSTTVRFTWTQALEWLAPKAVLDRAWEAWCTPPRPRRPRPPREGRPFELETGLGTLKAWEWGMSDEAETVLLVHGWGASAVTMEKLAIALAESGRQVIAFDLPAHGQSPGRTTNLVEMSRAVEAALWRFRPTAVIAHSLGASATALALEKGPRVQRAVLLAPGEDMTYFAHAFCQRAGLSQGIAVGLLTRIEERVGVSPSTLSLRHHPAPAGTQVLVMHDPSDTEVPWAHVLKLSASWGADTQLVAAPGVGHHLMPRVPSVIAAATAFTLEGQAPTATVRVLP